MTVTDQLNAFESAVSDLLARPEECPVCDGQGTHIFGDSQELDECETCAGTGEYLNASSFVQRFRELPWTLKLAQEQTAQAEAGEKGGLR